MVKLQSTQFQTVKEVNPFFVLEFQNDAFIIWSM